MAHHRWLPIAVGPGDAHAELISSGAAHVEAGPTFAAHVNEFTLLDSPTEELTALPVHELTGAYYRQLGVIWDGAHTL
jgi:acetoacetate decarboxylase